MTKLQHSQRGEPGDLALPLLSRDKRKVTMIKHTLVRWDQSQHIDGSPMFPEPMICTWLFFAGVWIMVQMQPAPKQEIA